MIHRRKFIALTTTSTLLLTSGALSAKSIFTENTYVNLKTLYKNPLKMLFIGDISKAIHFVNQCEVKEKSIDIVGFVGSNSPSSGKTFQSIDHFFNSGQKADVVFIVGKKMEESVIENLLKADLDVWIDRPATFSIEKQQKLQYTAESKNKKLLFAYLHNNQLNFEKNTIIKEFILS